MAKMSKNEIGWVEYCAEDGSVRYTITSSEDRSWYYIYDASADRLGKARSPIELENKYIKK